MQHLYKSFQQTDQKFFYFFNKKLCDVSARSQYHHTALRYSILQIPLFSYPYLTLTFISSNPSP